MSDLRGKATILVAGGLLIAGMAVLLWVANRPDSVDGDREAVARWVYVVDAAFAEGNVAVVNAIIQAGGEVLSFAFPEADYPNGRRYVWARDVGPLQMPITDGGWVVWDAINGGSTPPALENEANSALARLLGAPYRRLDLVVQGGNWLLLPDGRVITTTKLLRENPDRSPAELRSLLERHGIQGLILLEPLPGDSTQHADMMVNVDLRSGNLFVGQVWPEALAMIPEGEQWDELRTVAEAMAAELEEAASLLAAAVAPDRVHRLPQPLPRLDSVPEGAPPIIPSFVNGIFVTGADGTTTYLYGLAGDPRSRHFYSLDVSLLERYQEAVEGLGRRLGFRAVAVPTGGLARGGGSLHCTTAEVWLDPSRADLASGPNL